MTIGTVTCVHGCTFRVMRGWLTRFRTSGVTGPPVITGSTYFWAAATWPIDVTLKFLPAFYPWSKGAFQLSSILVEAYYQNLPTPTKIPLDVEIRYLPAVSLTEGASVAFSLANNPNDFLYWSLPPVDQPYWYLGTEA